MSAKFCIVSGGFSYQLTSVKNNITAGECAPPIKSCQKCIQPPIFERNTHTHTEREKKKSQASLKQRFYTSIIHRSVYSLHTGAHNNPAAFFLHLSKNDDFLTMDSQCVPFLRRRVFPICMNVQSARTLHAC